MLGIGDMGDEQLGTQSSVMQRWICVHTKWETNDPLSTTSIEK